MLGDALLKRSLREMEFRSFVVNSEVPIKVSNHLSEVEKGHLRFLQECSTERILSIICSSHDWKVSRRIGNNGIADR